MDRRTM